MHNIKYILILTDFHNVTPIDGLMVQNSLTFPKLRFIF